MSIKAIASCITGIKSRAAVGCGRRVEALGTMLSGMSPFVILQGHFKARFHFFPRLSPSLDVAAENVLQIHFLVRSALYLCIGSSSINLCIRLLNDPSGFINCASELTKLSATWRMHPKNPYSKTHEVWSHQLATSTVNSTTSPWLREVEASSEIYRGCFGCLLCISSKYLIAAFLSVP